MFRSAEIGKGGRGEEVMLDIMLGDWMDIGVGNGEKKSMARKREPGSPGGGALIM